jgi:hypothetical protein
MVNKLGVVIHACDPSYTRNRDRRIAAQDQPWAKKKMKILALHM